jgi:hypothetical protein
MSESVKIGGIGKNPAIDRINQLNATDIKKQAVKRIEQLLLEPELPQAGKYHRAVPIDFDSADWKGSQKNKQIREVNSHGNKRGRSYMSGVRLSPGEDPYHTPAGMAETVKRNTGKKIPVQDNPAGSVFRYAGRTDNHIQPVGQTVTGKTGIYSGARDSAGHQPYLSREH